MLTDFSNTDVFPQNLSVLVENPQSTDVQPEHVVAKAQTFRRANER